MKLMISCVVVLAACFGTTLPLRAQAPAEPPSVDAQTFTDGQLDQLLGPIALYPDPLIAEILPAATFPSEISAADQYVSGGGDPSQLDQQGWDPSVQAVARYPNVLKWMDDNLNWTTQMGQAFANQQPAVMASIQRLRGTASNLGNLQSTPQQTVTSDDGEIDIAPTDPNEIYVPEYQPDQVYYDQAYGAPYITFGIGWPIGPWLLGDFDWRNHHLIWWDHDHPRPANWWHTPVRERDVRNAPVWRPENHAGPVAVNRGDRGWSAAPAPLIVRGQPVRQAPQREARPVEVARPTPPPPVERSVLPPEEHFEPASRPEENGAFIGVGNTRQTSGYSQRGQESLRAAPAARPAPAPRPSGGGGSGGHSSGSQRH